MATVYGIATDKLVRLAGWEHKNQGGGNFGEVLARSLSKGGKFTVEVEPVEVIDVTPEDEDG